LAEARHLSRDLAGREGPDYLWPGFRLEEVPVAFYLGSRETFLFQHPDPPTEFRFIDVPVPGLRDVPLYYHRGRLPYLPAVGPVVIRGFSVATLPLSVFRPGVPAEALVAGIVHEAFHAYHLGRDLWKPDLALLSRYPELSAVNNALGTLEGLVLHDWVGATLLGVRCPRPVEPGTAGGREAAARAAFEFSLIRRERRGPLEDDLIEYERRLEASEGLARYVQFRALLGASPPAAAPAGSRDREGVPAGGYSPGPAFETLSGRETYARVPGLIAEQVDKLSGLNVHAAGAAWWRFFHTGMALALLADYLDPEWKTKAEQGQPLDSIIEAGVQYDGGPGDERALELLKERYGFDERLESEREFGRRERRRKEELLVTLLRGTGTRLTFDVSSLIAEETWWEAGRFSVVWDPSSVETVTSNVRIHRHGLRFSGYGTELRFDDGLPVVEDLKNRLFHVSVPWKGNLTSRGDGHQFSLRQPSEFEDGLELLLPGVSARARSGYVQDTGDTLYIKITR